MTPELRERAKVASVARTLVHRAGRQFLRGGAGSNALVGAGTGAVIGAGSAVAQGQDAGTAVRRGLTGAALGGAAGGVAGGAGKAVHNTRLLNPQLKGWRQAMGATAGRMQEGMKNFGKRQWYGFTGRGDAKAIGLGSAGAKKELKLRHAQLQDDLKHVKDPAKRQRLQERASKELKGIREEGVRREKAHQLGITSLPGTVKGLAGPRRKEVLKALWDESTGGSRLATAATFGLPTLFHGPGLLKGDESAEGGLNKKQKITRLATDVGGGFLTGGLPIVPQIIGGAAIDAAGDVVSGANKAQKRERELQQMADRTGMAQAVQQGRQR